MVNEFNEYVRDCFSETGDIVIKSMMGGYLVYFKGKLIGDICGDELLRQPILRASRVLFWASAGESIKVQVLLQGIRFRCLI